MHVVCDERMNDGKAMKNVIQNVYLVGEHQKNIAKIIAHEMICIDMILMMIVGTEEKMHIIYVRHDRMRMDTTSNGEIIMVLHQILIEAMNFQMEKL